jgi:vacuolar-type H+-ATPase subunit C/Vma6
MLNFWYQLIDVVHLSKLKLNNMDEVKLIWANMSTAKDVAELAMNVLDDKELSKLANIIDQNVNDKFYKVTMNDDADGKLFTTRTNMGFDSYTLLGMLNSISADVMEQIKGNNTPDVVQKTVIEK